MEFAFEQARDAAELIFHAAGEFLHAVGLQLRQADDPIALQHGVGYRESLVLQPFRKMDFPAGLKLLQLDAGFVGRDVHPDFPARGARGADGRRVAVGDPGPGGFEDFRNGPQDRRVGVDAFFRRIADEQIGLEQDVLVLPGEFVRPADKVDPLLNGRF